MPPMKISSLNLFVSNIESVKTKASFFGSLFASHRIAQFFRYCGENVYFNRIRPPRLKFQFNSVVRIIFYRLPTPNNQINRIQPTNKKILSISVLGRAPNIARNVIMNVILAVDQRVIYAIETNRPALVDKQI